MAQVICDEFTNKSFLFKPLFACFEAFKIYNKLLASYPVTTKSITSGILGAAGATVSSVMNTVCIFINGRLVCHRKNICTYTS
jgi:hypothetical protein